MKSQVTTETHGDSITEFFSQLLSLDRFVLLFYTDSFDIFIVFSAAVTNDLGQLEKDLEETKSHDVISQIRELINDNPILDVKPDEHEKAKKETKAIKEKDEGKSKKQDKLRKPKDSIPTTHNEDEENAVARSLVNQEQKQKQQLKWAKDVVNERSQENKRAFEKTKNFLTQIEEGLMQFQNGF